MIGVEMTSFIALLGAAGLALGMALSGTLQNFAGGVMLLFFKPFKVGDLIESQGHIGTVKEIQIFVTMLLTPENKTVFLPNGAVSNNEITNYATQGKIRVDLVVGISYNDSIDKAKSIIAELMSAHKYIISEPKAFVGVLELGDSSVNLAVRPYCKPQDYWKVYFELLEQIKLALDENGIEIPFPQRVVHQINKS
jgi:small conductance mechanosensitive channel